MPRWRLPSAIACLSALFVALTIDAAARGTPTPPSDADITKSFETQIAQLDALGSKAPQALETHLRYANYLAKAQGQECGVRLNAAQSELQAARQNVALGVVLPQGLARAADIEYQIHTALASCGDSSDTSHRDLELHAALESAENAARLYQDSFDYPAMVTMRFNAAVADQSLGDSAAAVTALKSVIDADREFGFRDDAEENYQLLLHWSHTANPDQPADRDQSADHDQVAALMQDFPQRTTNLKFAWVPSENSITLKTESTRVIGNEIVHASGDRTLTRQVRRRPLGWIVKYQSLASHYSLEPLSTGTGMGVSFMNSLAGMLLQFHDFSLTDTYSSTLGRGADFNQTINADSFKLRAQQEAQVHQEGNSLLGSLEPRGTRAAVLTPLLNTVMNELQLPAAVEAQTALDYNLETGAWPGATLEQGQWYGMKISLPLPHAPLNYVLHEAQFAFTRELACSKDSERICVEIVLRAIPDDTDLKRVLRHMQRPLHFKQRTAIHSSSTMYMRLVTDPATLQVYSRDMRQQFYASLDAAPNGALLGTERSVMDAAPVDDRPDGR